MLNRLSDVLDPVLLLGRLGVIPVAHVAHQIAGDAADPAEGPGSQMVVKIHILPVHMDVHVWTVPMGYFILARAI